MTGRPLAVVTGASAGIGRELADILAREGHDLVLVARRDAELKALAEDLHQRHGAISTVAPVDLSHPDAADQVLAAIGPEAAVDVLVNNAGFGGHGAFASGHAATSCGCSPSTWWR